ncbi:MAG: hypothetical protein GX592_01350 [Clostridiales bacterium]|nr:hypothetical protein [Clostridiales bacterium]
MAGTRSPRTGTLALVAACLLAVCLGALLQYHVPWLRSDSEAPGDSDSPVRLSEVMTANASAFRSGPGAFSDWVEIENAGPEPVNLGGYTLTEVGNIVDRFAFPAQALAAGESVVVYLDGVKRNTAGYALHAAFRLSASGAALELRDASGALADGVEIPELNRNEVYRRGADGRWEKSREYTPGMANTLENHLLLAGGRAECPVEISELMAANARGFPDGEGLFFDYIELHNRSPGAVDLGGYFLSDSSENPAKWRFPAGILIPAGEYLVVYASGLSGINGGDVHAGFRLSSGGEEVVLSDPDGVPVDAVKYPALLTDQAYSRLDGEFTVAAPPTPGMANTRESADELQRSSAAGGARLNEIMASPSDADYDWLEIANASGEAVDLSGWGLSDDASEPRKWRFPENTVLEPGRFLGVFLSGLEGRSASGVLHAGFRLSQAGGYPLTLSRPDGTVADRVFVPEQFTGVSYQRMADGSFRYAGAATPNAENASAGYLGRCGRPAFSAGGGLYQDGETVAVEIAAEPGARVYYTLNCEDPDESSTPYAGPIVVTGTAVLRARAYMDDMLPSYAESQTYLFGVSHTLRVVSLVSDPDNLAGPNGIHANYEQDWEREGHVEIYAPGGDKVLSGGCGLKLHGADSRKLPQKNFKVIARGEYGANRFDAALFSDRPYGSYQSFILRSGAEEGPKTRMRDAVLTELASGTGVFYQETEMCAVYINGIYWGHYYMRERISAASICQFENWEGQEDRIDLVKGNASVLRGSDESYQRMLSWVGKNGVKDGAALEKVGEVIDLDNYIAYHALQIFVGNSDTLNIKRYRNQNADGRWRWAVYDFDWAFNNDTNSIGRWLNPGGMGAGRRTDNALFIALMKNAAFRDRFLTFIGGMMATDWTTEKILRTIEERYNELLPELPAQLRRWGQSEANFRSELGEFVDYAKARPKKLIGYFRETLSLSDADMERYFGDAIRLIQGGNAI